MTRRHNAGVAKPDWAGPFLVEIAEAYASFGPDEWRSDKLKATMEALMLSYEIKLGKAQALPRVAVTGRSVGPPLFEALEVLGQNETLRRLRNAVTRMASKSEAD